MRVRITPEFPGLVISDEGTIWGPRGHRLQPFIDKDGYLMIGAASSPHPRRVNVLVCIAFHGPKPSPDHHAAHWNDVKSDNRAENLRWATPAENIGDDRDRNSRTAHGEINGNARLTEKIVTKIREMRASGTSISELSRTHGVARSTIRRICERKTWGHVS